MREEFLGVLLMLGAAAVLAVLLLAASLRFGTKWEPTARQDPGTEDSGIEASGIAPDQRFSNRFFLAAMFFALIDLAVLLLYPWAALLRELPSEGVVSAGVFALPVAVGVLYGWRKGALRW